MRGASVLQYTCRLQAGVAKGVIFCTIRVGDRTCVIIGGLSGLLALPDLSNAVALPRGWANGTNP